MSKRAHRGRPLYASLSGGNVRLCQLMAFCSAFGQASGCITSADDADWVSEAKQALSFAGDRELEHSPNNKPAFVYSGSLADALEFWRPHATGNGRSCATCHRPEDNFALTPKTVEARWQLLQVRRREDPQADDPLFRAIDADDFADDFTTLRTRALVRVTLPLPNNIQVAENPKAATVAVFRAVPTVLNAAITAPFQSDGRLATLEEQAHQAMLEHSQIRSPPSPLTVTRLANFQRQLFSSERIRELPQHPNLAAPSAADSGRQTFERFCASCHGGPTLTVNEDARFLPVPARGPRPEGPQQFINIFVQTPRPPPPVAPLPAPATPHFFDGLPTADLPIITYNVSRPDSSRASVQSSDAGRMLITGDIRENGRFDVPTLFGAAYTAPYFHDNSAETLEAVIRHYQALFELMAFLDVEAGLFAPASHAQGCERGSCGFTRIPDADIPELLAYLRRL